MLLRLQMLTEHSGAHERLKSNQMVVEEFFFSSKKFSSFFNMASKREVVRNESIAVGWRLAVGS